MVMRNHGGWFGLGSGVNIEPIDEWMWEFILSKIARGILEQTHVIFGTIKEGIMKIIKKCLNAYHDGFMELLDERLGAFQTKFASYSLILGVQFL